MLGFDDYASSDDIAAEVGRLVASTAAETAEPDARGDGNESVIARRGAGIADPARYVPMAEFERTLAELHELRAKFARERAERQVENAMKAGKITPAQREWAIAYCQSDATSFQKFIVRQAAVIAGSSELTIGTESGRSALPHTRSALTRTEATVCARLCIKSAEYLERRAIHSSDCREDHHG
jgi:phage I-like protein